MPIRGEFLTALREITQKQNRLLIFDEVISGFRVHPGGAQAHYDVRPDLTTLAKILAGGLPTYRPVVTFAWRDKVEFKGWPQPGFWRQMQEVGLKQ